jgi:hypothetical protein
LISEGDNKFAREGWRDGDSVAAVQGAYAGGSSGCPFLFNPRDIDISTRDTDVCPFSIIQFVVMKTELVELKGRKALVAGRVEALDGTLLVEAE